MYKKQSNHGVWILDSDVENCKDCQQPFTIFRRKHHCRYCGNIFCSSCRTKSIMLQPNQVCYGAKKGFFESDINPSKHKVCNTCFNVLYEPMINKDQITRQKSTKKLLDSYSS